MDAPDLSAFVRVAETRSFSAAAAQLHLTQSAISRRIATLERELDSRLFDRIGRSVSLTAAGNALLPRARRILQDMEDSRTLVRNLQGTVSGALVLGTSHHIGLHRLPPLLRRFSESHPDVSLELHFLDSETAYERLLQGELELAVVTLAPAAVTPLISAPVWNDPLVFVAAADHPLAQLQSLRLSDLARERAVLPGAGTYTGRIVTHLFERHGLQLNASMSTNYLETIRMMASIGLGWSVLPEQMLNRANANLVQLQPADAAPMQRHLGWVRHPARTASNAVTAFMALLEDAAAAQPDRAP